MIYSARFVFEAVDDEAADGIANGILAAADGAVAHLDGVATVAPLVQTEGEDE